MSRFPASTEIRRCLEDSQLGEPHCVRRPRSQTCLPDAQNMSSHQLQIKVLHSSTEQHDEAALPYMHYLVVMVQTRLFSSQEILQIGSSNSAAQHLLQLLHVSRHLWWQFATPGRIEHTWEDDIKAASQNRDHTCSVSKYAEDGKTCTRKSASLEFIKDPATSKGVSFLASRPTLDTLTLRSVSVRVL